MMADEARLRERIARGAPVLLDGALGTELEREGIRSELPLWNARRAHRGAGGAFCRSAGAANESTGFVS
jgi:hypothetical protein